MATEREEPYFEILLEGQENPLPALLDVTSFLYDVNLLYEFSRIAVDPKYAEYHFSPEQSWRRDGRPLSDSDRLHVVQLRHESPIFISLTVAAVAGAVAAVWGMVQIVDKVYNMPVDHKLKRLQCEMLEEQIKASRAGPQKLPSEAAFHDQLEARGAAPFIDRTVHRLLRCPIRIRDFVVRVIEGPHRPS
jgi:hypothetical protein